MLTKIVKHIIYFIETRRYQKLNLTTYVSQDDIIEHSPTSNYWDITNCLQYILLNH